MLLSLVVYRPADADPTIAPPPAGRAVISRDDAGGAGLVALADIDALFALVARGMPALPEVGALDGGDLGLAGARLGLLFSGTRLSALLRVDLSEALRIDGEQLGDQPLASAGRFIDDAALFWIPRVWANIVLGRFKVPFSRFRQLERGALTTGSVPFPIDRVAPDRRWGLTCYGDVGAMAYAAGAYADFDALELRSGDGDPSSGGRMIATGYVWWTPRAPIGPDHMATPPSDPWYHTMRPAGGIGVQWRQRDSENRLEASLTGQIKYRRYAGIAELFLSAAGEARGFGIAAESSVLLHPRAVIFVRADFDSESAADPESEIRRWSAGAGSAFFLSADRLGKVSLFAWMRGDDGTRGDGVVIRVHGSL